MKISLSLFPLLLLLPVTLLAQTVSEQLQKPPRQLILEKLLTDMRELPTDSFIIKRVGGPSGSHGLRVELVRNSVWYIIEYNWWSDGVKIRIQSREKSSLGSILIVDNDADGQVDVGRFNDKKVFWSFDAYGTVGQEHRRHWQLYYEHVLLLLRVITYK